eukprot:SM000084S23133  [mRNA]  locus=s84:378417:379445:+ [translate_table: standard]
MGVPDLTHSGSAAVAQILFARLCGVQKDEFGSSIARIIDWFGQLQEIDVADLPPAIRVADAEDDDVVRQDVPVIFDNRELMLAEVPVMEGKFLKVPKISSDNAE